MLSVRHYPLFNLRMRSLARGNIAVLISLLLALYLSHFPNNRASPLLIIPMLGAIAGTADTVRCMRRRWNFYHAGVILCLYTDLMALTIIAFLLVYPYAALIISSR